MRALLKRKLQKSAFCDGVSLPSRFVLRSSFFGALTDEGEDGQASVRVSGFSVPCDWRLKSPAGSTVDTELQQEKSVLEIVGLRILADK